MANPWTYAEWNLTAQGDLIRRWGLVTAHKMAKEAGTTVGGPRPPSPTNAPVNKTFILNKRIGSTNISTGGGTGSSGDGPPT